MVVITGDIVQDVRDQEAYARARRWIEEELLPAIPGLNRSRVLVVPGENDANFEVVHQAASYPGSPIVYGAGVRQLPGVRGGLLPVDEFPVGAAVIPVRQFKVGFARLVPAWIPKGGSLHLAFGREHLDANFRPLREADVRIALTHQALGLLGEEGDREFEEALRRAECPLLVLGARNATELVPWDAGKGHFLHGRGSGCTDRTQTPTGRSP